MKQTAEVVDINMSFLYKKLTLKKKMQKNTLTNLKICLRFFY